jgi:uncharacterized membrane protein YsdA (DUF1294 family)
MAMPSRPRRLNPASFVILAAFALAYAVVAVLRDVVLWTHLLYAGASALCFTLYAVDKGEARAGRERISESMLLSLGFVGGWPGAIVAQQLYRHKTAKLAFRIRFWLSVAANAALFLWATTHVTPSP